tara:strand:- start:460 stop:741 length:282 start_codon:yes stop_codon:yes gene_type:complete
MSDGRKPPVGRLVVKHKESGERCELGCLWENRFSDKGNYDVSFYKQDEKRPEGQMDRLSLATFAQQGGPESYYVSHWTSKPRTAENDGGDVPF